MTRWGPTAVMIALLGATAVAFATTERQKLEKTPLDARVDELLSPVCRCSTDTATIELRLRHRHLVTVEIVGAGDRSVRTLARDRDASGTISFVWNGEDSRGRRVPDRSYRPRVTLDDGRVFTLPNPIRVDSVAPRAALVSYRPHVLPHRRVKRRVVVDYRLSEPAHVLLYVNGRRVLFGGAKTLRGEVEWFARLDGRRLRPGRYRLQLAAVDVAGNLGPRGRPFSFRVR